jgi:hypothetical protein
MAGVLKRVKPQFGAEEMRMVACFALRSLSHELVCRLAKRHGLQNPKDPRDYLMAEKARTLYKKADTAGLAVLIFEAMLLGSAVRTTESKDDDALSIAASLFKIDTKALRANVARRSKRKRGTRLRKPQAERSQSLRRNSLASEITEKRGCPSLTAPLFPGLMRDRPLARACQSSIEQRHRVAFAGRGHFHGRLQGGIVFVMSPIWQTPCRPTLQSGETPKNFR